MKILIRDAKENDMAKIFDLVQELAIFEKEPDAIEIDVAYYIKHGFKKNPRVTKRPLRFLLAS